MNRPLLRSALPLFAIGAALAMALNPPTTRADGPAVAPSGAPSSAEVPSCAEVCSTAVRLLGDCELLEGGQAAISRQARIAQLDCSRYCATAPAGEVARIDACFPRMSCELYRECIAAPGTTAPPQPVATKVRPTDGAEMVLVPAGPFTRGVPRAARTLQDADASIETLPEYFIDREEVTVSRYRRCVGVGACSAPSIDSPRAEGFDGESKDESEGEPEAPFDPKNPVLIGCNWGVPGRGNHPVNCIDYDAARAYCKWAGARLPSEMEWEKAARGVDGRRYPWGIAGRTCDRLVWRAKNSDESRDCAARSTAEVGTHPAGASPFGVHDMSGNVWEWVGGYHSELAYAEPNTDRLATPRQAYGVVRGGGWGHERGEDFSHDATTRFVWFKANRIEGVGFRCAMGAQ